MRQFCQDKRLLAIEPRVFLTSGLPAQTLISGSGGAIIGTSFTAAAGGFTAAGISAGMVLCTYTTSPSEGNLWEIVSVKSNTELQVSILRGDQASP